MPELIDLPAFASAFGRAIHDAGIPVTPERSARLARALSLSPPGDRDRLYWTARTVFVSGPEHVDVFDRVFAWVFGGLGDVAGERGDPNAPPLTGVQPGVRPPAVPARPVAIDDAGREPLPAASAAPSLTELTESDAAVGERDVPVAAASSAERLLERNFAELSPEELRAVWRLMHELRLAPPSRLTRRARRDAHGDRLDVRATLRAARRTGGDPAHRITRRRVRRPRRLILICDISGSMEPYARAYLQLLHAAVGGADAEAFVFATRLTRVTRALRGRQPDVALAEAGAVARDWSSGTRIGDSLRRFTDEYGRRGMARGAVIVIVSDGWERGEPELLGREMARLRRLAHRIIWVNPRKASPRFVPLTGGMGAALPFCNAFVSGHSVRALSAVAAAIAARDHSGAGA